MGLITLQIPQSGLDNATEDPKVATDLTTIGNLVNGNIDLANLSAALQGLVPAATWTTYTPGWTSSGVAPSVGSGTLSGAFVKFGKTCLFQIYLLAGGTTNGGTGALSFGLPAAAASGVEQDVPCKLFATADGSNWMGFGVIATGSSQVNPHFPANSTTPTLSPFTNSTNALQSTGTPLISGSFPVTSGSIFTCSGAYRTT